MQALRMLTVRQSTPEVLPPARRSPLALVVGVVITAALLAGAALLWVAYGTKVFFEMIAAGIAACF